VVYRPQVDLSAIADVTPVQHPVISDIEPPTVKKKLIREYLVKPETRETPVDLVSNIPIAEVEDLEKDPRTLNLSEEEKKLEGTKGKRAGNNDSVITRG
jgi:hypothetical protein